MLCSMTCISKFRMKIITLTIAFVTNRLIAQVAAVQTDLEHLDLISWKQTRCLVNSLRLSNKTPFTFKKFWILDFRFQIQTMSASCFRRFVCVPINFQTNWTNQQQWKQNYLFEIEWFRCTNNIECNIVL